MEIHVYIQRLRQIRIKKVRKQNVSNDPKGTQGFQPERKK